MKQTIEEAEKEYCDKNYPYSDLNIRFLVENAFEAGAAWQSKQYPWISVEERLPEKDGDYIVTDGNIVIVAYFFKCWGKFARYKKYPYAFYENNIKLYMPIPTFDEILKANKDVLERIKEKEVNHG